MKLYVPKNWPMPTDVKEDQHPMDLSDMLMLKEIMEQFEDFEQLRRCVAKNYKKEKVQIRYPNLATIWDESKLPNGSLRDTFFAVINVFGGSVPAGCPIKDRLPYPMLVARVGDEFGCEYKTAKGKVTSLKNGKYLKEEFGQILFPKELMK